MSSRLRKAATRASVAAALVLVAACSGAAAGGDLASTFVGASDGGAGEGGGAFPTTIVDAAPVDASVADVAPISCSPTMPPSFKPVWIAPTVDTACTTEELGAYFDSCANKPEAPACLGWVANHPKCGQCLERPDNSGPIQLHVNRIVFTLNVAGCISIVENANGGDDTCASAYDAHFQCRRQSCEQCFAVPAGASYEEFQKCQAAASSSDCKSLSEAQSKACVGVKTDGAPQCFPTTAENAAMTGKDADKAKAATRSFFVRVEGLFCGP